MATTGHGRLSDTLAHRCRHMSMGGARKHTPIGDPGCFPRMLGNFASDWAPALSPVRHTGMNWGPSIWAEEPLLERRVPTPLGSFWNVEVEVEI
jgi:hypothetical protein